MSKWTQTRIKLSDQYSDEEKEAIASDIIEYLKDRTRKGRGEGGKKWKAPADKYTKEYKESLDFKIAGKTNKVNLTLTGDMLDSIDLLKSSPSSITIGISEDDQDHGKAEGNIRGTYGKKRGSSKKARNFLAITDDEVEKILKKYPLDNDKKREQNTDRYKRAYEAAMMLAGNKEAGITLGAIRTILDEE